jgi:hypothetical protein
MKLTIFFALLFSAVIFISCLGVSADITIRQDGSGRIVLEYRVSQLLESIGRLDGNERQPAIPVGRGDFERGIARIPGLRLVSYSAKDAPGASGGRDLVTRAELEFSNTDALTAFLDSTGVGVTLTGTVPISVPQQGLGTTLRLVLLNPAESADADLLSLLREISGGYEISVSLTAPGNASLALTPPVPEARAVTGGRKVSFAVGTGVLFGLNEGLELEIGW